MKVILLQSVPKLGKKDDVITVPDGYAQNALFPKRIAVVATDAAIKALQQNQKNKVVEKEIQYTLLNKAIEGLVGKTLVYKAKKSEKGSLFSKVTEADISNAFKEQYAIAIDAKLLTIEGGAIKQVGTYTVLVKEGSYKNSFFVTVQ
jgi:large subunit ribosomal protein L9